MRSGRIRWALVPALCVAAVSMSRSAEAVPYCGGVTDNCNCGKNNPCICCSTPQHTYNGNCVWWAWHKACCSWGVGLQWCTNAYTWDNYANSYNYPVRKKPCEKTIFVCETYTSQCGSGGYGHVGWVKQAYPNGSIDVSEQGCFSFYGVRHRHIAAQLASPDMKYIYKKGTSCDNCECNPGSTQSQSCGDCGTRTRTCKADCTWGNWSSCTGQGPCTPGATESRDCCDCGTESRTCQQSCHWSDWGGCSGPDPSDAPACDTGEPGICAAGRIRCVEGCLTCRPDVAPADELCDDLDNDCDGEVDEERPDELGEPPPAFAARVLDWSAPQALAPGETGIGWILIQNVGLQEWPSGSVALQARTSEAGPPSELWDPATWSDEEVLARIDTSVPPGDRVWIDFTVRLAEDARQAVSERVQLLGPGGDPVRCPAPGFELVVLPLPPSLVDTGEPDDPDATPEAAADFPNLRGGCSGCAAGQGASSGLPLLLLLFWRLGRRYRAR